MNTWGKIRRFFNLLSSPLRYTAQAPWMPQYSRSDQVGQMQTFGSVGTLFGVVDGISEAVAGVDWKLWQKSVSGREEERIQVERHQALDVWSNPNQFYSQDELIYAFQQHYELVGESNLVVIGNGATPQQLWCVRPDRLAPIPHPELFISGYEYKTPEGHKVPLEINEVMRIKRPNPLDPYRGMGAVQSVMSNIDALRFGNEWNARFFLNNAQPGGIIEMPDANGILGDREFTILRDRWEEQHKGIHRAHRVAIIEGGMVYKDRNYTMKDMQFQELNVLSREQILEAFRYSPAMLGRSTDFNRANIEGIEYMFSKWLLVARLERIKKMLNSKFLPMFGTYASTVLEFDYTSPVPEDEKSNVDQLEGKTRAYKTLIDAGVDAEDAAKTVGLPAMRIAQIEKPRELVTTDVTAYARRPSHPIQYRHFILDKENDPVREEWEEKLDDLLKDWTDISEKQRTELTDQISRAVDNGETGELAKLEVDSEAAGVLLLASLVTMAAFGADDVAKSAANQGVELAPAEVTEDELSVLATTTVALLGAGLATSAGREALRLLGPDSTGRQVSQGVRDHLAGLSDAFLRGQLGGALWAAEGAGRYATLAEGPRADYYVANETRDKRMCHPCKEIEGKKFYTLASAKKAYPTGGYHDCEGGLNCRGRYEPVWER